MKGKKKKLRVCNNSRIGNPTNKHILADAKDDKE